MGFLFFRSNPKLTFLKPSGYNAVAFPVVTLRPTNTLLRTTDSELTLFGDLETVVTGNAKAPSVSIDNVAPSSVNGVQSSSLDLKVGLSVLGNILKALTGSTLDVNAGFKSTKSVTFAYKDVLEDHVLLDQLDTFLSSSSFKEDLNVVRSALVSSNIFVITSTIKSQSITVKTQGEDSPSGGIEVPVIQGIASGKLSVDVTRANQGEITFSGSKPVVFGFKAVQVFTDENARYRIFKPVPSGSVELESVAEIKDEDMAFLDLGAVEVIEEERTAAQGMGSSR